MSSIREQANRLAADKPKGLSELWNRLFVVAIAFLIYRFGTHIPIPGINSDRIRQIFEQNEGTILGMFNMFSGGALERMSILALGIMPYITAAIIMQLLSSSGAVAHFAELKKEGEAGRRKISVYTRWLTLAIAIVQAIGMSVALTSQEITTVQGLGFFVPAVTGLVAGAMFIMWLGEQITEHGIGNGMSLLIFASIVAGIPAAIAQSFESTRQGAMDPMVLLVVFLIAITVVLFVVFIERGQRRVKVNYAQRQQGRRMVGGQQSHLPLKVNMAGVIPPIFASSLLLVPATMSQTFGMGGSTILQTLGNMLSPGQPLYMLIFSVLIVAFCYIYTAMTFDPRDVADNLKRSGAFLQGIRPGRNTSDYLDGVASRLTLWGSLYMVAVCLLPLFLTSWANVPFYLGGTSLLIVVVVVMDFMSQVQGHLMSSQYEKLMKKANLKKR